MEEEQVKMLDDRNREHDGAHVICASLSVRHYYSNLWSFLESKGQQSSGEDAVKKKAHLDNDAGRMSPTSFASFEACAV